MSATARRRRRASAAGAPTCCSRPLRCSCWSSRSARWRAGLRRLARRRRPARLAVPDQLPVAPGRERRHLPRAGRQHLRDRADRRAGAADRRRRGDLPRGVRRPQPAGAASSRSTSPTWRRAVDHLRPARARAVRADRWAWAAACWPAPRRWRCWCCRSSSCRRARRCAPCRGRCARAPTRSAPPSGRPSGTRCCRWRCPAS